MNAMKRLKIYNFDLKVDDTVAKSKIWPRTKENIHILQFKLILSSYNLYSKEFCCQRQKIEIFNFFFQKSC